MGQLFTYAFKKVALGGLCEKRYILDTGKSLAYGHPSIPRLSVIEEKQAKIHEEAVDKKIRLTRKSGDNTIQFLNTPDIFKNRNKILKSFLDQDVLNV